MVSESAAHSLQLGPRHPVRSSSPLTGLSPEVLVPLAGCDKISDGTSVSFVTVTFHKYLSWKDRRLTRQGDRSPTLVATADCP